MPRWAIADTGPLVAYLDRRERHHAWTVEQISKLSPPLLICEPVLTEALFLLARLPFAQDALLDLVEKRILRVDFQLEAHITSIRKLYRKYRDTPMSLADACIVSMAERQRHHSVLTLDSDFEVYRKHGRDPLLLIAPWR